MTYKWTSFNDFGGGLNEVNRAESIADNEFTELLNFEFTNSRHLRSRGGFVRYNISPDFTSRITSIYNFITSAQVSHLILTTGSEIYKDTAGVFSSIKGALTLPSNTYWRWATFNDLAIGVNGDSGAVSDIVKWNGAGNIADLALTGIAGAPVGAYLVETFNSRLWVVFKSLPNRLYFSTLGNPEDWASSGGFLEIGYNDNDIIVDIRAHRGVLFIFKRRSIYVLRTSINGQINTDPNGWEVKDFTRGGGCISQFGTQVVLNDLMFLSDEGLASISAVQEFGEFKAAIVSRKLNGLTNLNKAIDTFPSALLTPKSMYFIGVPNTITGTVNNRFYVLDYKDIEGGIRWTMFESSIVKPSAMASVIVLGKRTLFVGSDSPQPQIYKYDDTVFSDHNNTIILKRFASKSHTFNLDIERKECNRVAVGVSFSTNTLLGTWKLKIDKRNTLVTSFALAINSLLTGGVWDTGVWDVALFASGDENQQLIINKIKSEQGRRGIEFQQIFENNQLAQDLTVYVLGFEVEKITSEQK